MMGRLAMEQRLHSLRFQLLLRVILPLTLIIAAISVVSVISHQAAIRQAVVERDELLANLLAEWLKARLSLYARLLETVERLPPVLPEFDRGLFLSGPNGEIIPAVSNRSFSTELDNRLKAAMATARDRGRPDGPVPLVDLQSNQVALLFIVPRADRGTLLGLTSLESLGVPSLLQTVGLASRARISLVDSNGELIYRFDSQETSLRTSSVLNASVSSKSAPKSGEIVVRGAPLRGTGWQVVIEEPWTNDRSLLMRVSIIMGPIALVLIGVAAFIVLFFNVRYIARPLHELEAEAAKVARGEVDSIRRPTESLQEIRSLQSTLNTMTTQIRSCEIALHEYIAALNHAEEEERRRIARELHDDTVQMLVALMHQVEKCERSTDDPAMLARHLDGIRTLIVETLDRTRRLIYNLRPFYLDDLGLTAALELLARDIERETPELRIQIHVQGDPRRLSGDLELAAFRVVQEGLTNIVRHAKAHHADVWLDFGTECLTLHVRDDGQGFAVPQDLEDLAFAKHFGLMGMRERVTRFGGQMVVKSQLGQGTTLTVTLPYQARVAF